MLSNFPKIIVAVKKTTILCLEFHENCFFQTGDMVAALVKSEEENWILAEVVTFNTSTNKYEVDDIDEEQKVG